MGMGITVKTTVMNLARWFLEWWRVKVRKWFGLQQVVVTLICSSEGRVWTFGRGKYGELGHASCANEMVPRIVEGLMGVEVVQVAAGDNHTVILVQMVV